MKELWTDRRALWVDAVITVAALVGLQLHATDPHIPGWPYAWVWLRMVLLVLPLAIVIRRIEPAVALPVLILAVYLAGLLGQPPWLLYGGVVMALWSLAGRCRVPTAIIVATLSVVPPFLLDLERYRVAVVIYPYAGLSFGETDVPLKVGAPGMLNDDWQSVVFNKWPWWLSLAIILLTLVFLAVRRRTWAQAPHAWRRREELRTFLRGPDDASIRNVLLAVTVSGLILIEVGQQMFKGAWWSAPGWMPYGVAAAGLTLALRRWPVVPVVVLAAAGLISNWQSFTPNISLLGAFALALYWLVVSPRSSRSLRWTVPVAIIVLSVMPVMPVITRMMGPESLQLIFPQIKGGWRWSEYLGSMENPIYDGIVAKVWPISFSLALLLPVLAAVAMRQYRRNREAARREAELEQVAEELEAEQVVLTERSIIARDLHDVVAHAVNLMVIQAETGPDLLRRGEADVLAGFQRIGDAGRRALSELDRLLSTLRDEDGTADPQLAPQPGLSDLSQLVADVSEDHLPIELDLQGDLENPPEGQQLTAYRLVQEALTNVVKHAKATGARVAVRSEETGVRVEVTDDGVGFDVAAARRGNRHGLAGMRERVRIEGGTLDIRSTPGAGTTVDAWIPVGGRR